MIDVVIFSFLFSGFIVLLWQFIVASLDRGRLSWLFMPLEALLGDEYSSSVRFFVGCFLWLVLGPVIALPYFYLVENSILTYYDADSVMVYTLGLFTISMVIIMPWFKLGIGGWKLSAWVWLESVCSWVLFGYFVWLMIRL